jgi:RimJ/RimL family protein N-acetyltransferase
MAQQQVLAIGPVTLEGRWVRLEPLGLQHIDALAAVSGDEEIWRYLSMPLATHSEVATFVERALATAERGDEIPFVIVEKATATIVGSTRFMDIRREHRAVEVGSTWLGRDWWRSAINSEAKFLLLRHLFDDLGCLRVSLKTDGRNVRSQRAIERLGAVREGVLRKHMIVQNGYARDTVYFSIIDTEWPAIRSTMQRNLYGSPDQGPA